MTPAPNAVKVLIYAYRGGDLLVFDEPDFPDLPLQVPGGTVEAGESIADAAAREFTEETGIEGAGPFEILGHTRYGFEADGRWIIHERHGFRLDLVRERRQEWLACEETPSSGGPPIRLRFFWLPVDAARLRLGFGMERFLRPKERSCP